MCAIVDANVANTLFGSSPSRGEARLLSWIESGASRLVIGGTKMRRELFHDASDATRLWLANALRRGTLLLADDDQVDEKEVALIVSDACESDDQHIIALAQINGARLLYSNDELLRNDFLNRELVDDPRGRLYPVDGRRQQQERLLASNRLCQSRRCQRA